MKENSKGYKTTFFCMPRQLILFMNLPEAEYRVSLESRTFSLKEKKRKTEKKMTFTYLPTYHIYQVQSTFSISRFLINQTAPPKQYVR